VDQISFPMRIALAASLVFAALWFVALKPKPVADPMDGPLPTVAQPAESAKAGTAKASTPRAAREPKAKAAAPKATREAKPVAAPKGADAVLADIHARRPVVLLFWDPSSSSSDDRATRRAVSDIDRHGGKVRVHLADLRELSAYEAITKGAPVQASPTVLVIDRNAQATAITGLTVTREIDALVDRALIAAKN
jgi:hypothetical protein